METASDRAPAVDATLPGAEDELVSLYRAARIFDVNDATILKWARSGELLTVVKPRGNRTIRLVRPEHVARLLEKRREGEAALERAVDRYLAGETTVEIAAEIGCSPETIANRVRAAGHDLRAGGAPRLHPVPEARECASPRCDNVFTPAWPSWAVRPGRQLYCSRSCAAHAKWRCSDALLRRYSGAVRSRWKGRRYGHLGGRAPAREKDPEYAAKAERLLEVHRKNPRMGERALAEYTGLSRRQVRGLLGRS